MGKNKEENIIGKQIGIYNVLYECDFKSNDGHRMFHVKCSKCGWETDMQMHQIKYTKLCKHISKFGYYVSFSEPWKNQRLRKIYYGIMTRCYDKNDKAYRWYGAKGIKVCDEWIKNPKSFEEWALSNGYQDDLSIDRINENKDYYPENCRWITLENNSKYKSTTNLIEVDGEVHTGREWSQILDLGLGTINLYFRKYPNELVKEFIRQRQKDKTKKRKSHQTWFDVYNIR